MADSIVICSGGLDSTTVAAHAKLVEGRDPLLMHFCYGCRAEQREVAAVARIAEYLDCECLFPSLHWLQEIGGSSLTEHDRPIAGPVEGAEYPHEWVPARNLVMMSHAAAYCDARGLEAIYMGLNLEEGGVYPDNTVEFFERLNQVLQVSTLVRPVIRMPLARKMKWQIVRYAYEIGAPIHLSWSCYRGGKIHCGDCGPCFMRQTAHRMIGRPDSIRYEVSR